MNTIITSLAVAGILATGAVPSAHKTVTVADLAGQSETIPNPTAKATVLLFVSKDCPYSNGEAPTMSSISDAYSKRGFSFVYVYGSPSTQPADATKHAHDYGFTAPCVLDTKQTLVAATGATTTPEAVVYSASGKLLYKGRIDNKYEGIGYPRTTVTKHDLTDALDAIAAGKTPVHAFVQPVGCTIPRG